MKKWHFFIISIFVVLVDQITKYYALQKLILYDAFNLFTGVNFTLVYNTGSAFSFLSDSGAWHHWFFKIFSFVISIVIIIWMMRTPKNAYRQLVGLSLILGGAIGNLIDRILLNHVIDFIDIYYSIYHWPVFNIADSAIVCGAVLLFFSLGSSQKSIH